MHRVMVTALALVAAVEAVSGVAQAAPTGPAVARDASNGAARAGARTSLVLTVAKGESTGAGSSRAVLTCQPAGGSHHQAKDACAELAKVGGRFERLQQDGGVCMTLYDPVTVTANGTWKGRKVAYRHTFSNSCVLTATTGKVFSL